MTREEEIRNAIDTIFPIPPSEKGRKYEQALMATGFEAGVKWTDAHPKSPWINVKDDLPCNHEELMRSSFFTRTVLALSDEIELEFAYMHKTVTDEWKWTSIRNVKYWMSIPELPKE